MNSINTNKLNAQSQIVDEELTLDLLKAVHGGFGPLVKTRVFDAEWYFDNSSNGPFLPDPTEEELHLSNDLLTNRVINEMSQFQTLTRLQKYF